MRKFGKKGGIEETIKDSGLSLAVIVILLVMAGAFGSWVYARTSEKKCEFSTWANDKTSDIPFVSFGLDCPAPHQDIKTKNNEKIYATIATQLKTCWQKMGAGRKVILDSKVVGTKRNCAVCSSFTLPKDINWMDVATYMESTPVPPTMKQTYSDLIDTHNKKMFKCKSYQSGIPAEYANNDFIQDHVGNMLLFFLGAGAGSESFDRTKWEVPHLYNGHPVNYLVVYVLTPEASLLGDGTACTEAELKSTDESAYTMYVIRDFKYTDLKCDTFYYQYPEDDSK